MKSEAVSYEDLVGEAPVLEAVEDPEEVERSENRLGKIIGAAPIMLEMFRQVQLVAQTDVTVLVEGETGTVTSSPARERTSSPGPFTS